MTVEPWQARFEIEEAFGHYCREPSDVREHLPLLRALAEDVSRNDPAGLAPGWTIAEFGVRNVVSTWAFLAARPAKMVSVDIAPRNEAIERCADVCRDAGQSWHFVQASTLELEPIQCDLLFVDTLHTYWQLSAELLRHEAGVRKWIALHDTETFGHSGEDGTLPGLQAAVAEFLQWQRGRWVHSLVRTNCNGLTVLRRVR